MKGTPLPTTIALQKHGVPIISAYLQAYSPAIPVCLDTLHSFSYITRPFLDTIMSDEITSKLEAPVQLDGSISAKAAATLHLRFKIKGGTQPYKSLVVQAFIIEMGDIERFSIRTNVLYGNKISILFSNGKIAFSSANGPTTPMTVKQKPCMNLKVLQHSQRVTEIGYDMDVDSDAAVDSDATIDCDVTVDSDAAVDSDAIVDCDAAVNSDVTVEKTRRGPEQ